jgi:hypothetical protein
MPEHVLDFFREPEHGLVVRWCPVCERHFVSAEEHDEALAAAEAAHA